MSQFLRGVGTATAGLVGLLLLAGCLSDNPGSSSLAYIDIESHGAEVVRAETVRVFADDNYQLVGESAARLVFEREATQRDRVLFGRYGDEQVVMRVVVSIAPRRQGGCLVRADGYAVRDGSEEPIPRVARRPYQDQLNRVRASLVSAGGAK